MPFFVAMISEDFGSWPTVGGNFSHGANAGGDFQIIFLFISGDNFNQERGWRETTKYSTF